MVADETEAADICCASCGIAEVDEIKLTKCDACDLVRFCSEQDHQSQHEARCKERATELRNEILFRQPEISHMGDCPICFLPLPFEHQKSMLHSCCSKLIRNGCAHAYKLRERERGEAATYMPILSAPLTKNL